MGYREVNLPLRSVRVKPRFPKLPVAFNKWYEVPFGLKVGTTFIAAAFGRAVPRSGPYALALRQTDPQA